MRSLRDNNDKSPILPPQQDIGRNPLQYKGFDLFSLSGVAESRTVARTLIV